MTMATYPKRTSTLDKHATTPGEELYLVHLRRLREEEDDHDHLPRKRRSSSVGEELWEIHQRRSLGMAEDEDTDRDHTGTVEKEPSGKNPGSAPSKALVEAPKDCRYNLRSRSASLKKV